MEKKKDEGRNEKKKERYEYMWRQNRELKKMNLLESREEKGNEIQTFVP